MPGDNFPACPAVTTVVPAAGNCPGTGAGWRPGLHQAARVTPPAHGALSPADCRATFATILHLHPAVFSPPRCVAVRSPESQAMQHVAATHRAATPAPAHPPVGPRARHRDPGPEPCGPAARDCHADAPGS